MAQAELHPALWNNAAGVIVTVRGRLFAIMGFIVAGSRIVEIDAIADSNRAGGSQVRSSASGSLTVTS